MNKHLNFFSEDSAQKIWQILSKSLLCELEKNGASEVMKGLKEFKLDSCVLPTFKEIDAMLNTIGWSTTPVDGFISSKFFHESLARQVLPVSIHMRSIDNLDFSAEPDYFHEVFGHVALLAHPQIRSFLKRYGEIGLSCFSFDGDDHYLQMLSDVIRLRKSIKDKLIPKIFNLGPENTSELVQLTRLGWWTFETGILKVEGENRAWGAALISSLTELKNFSIAPIKPLTLDCTFLHFDPSTYQSQYFYIDSFTQLTQILNDFEIQIEKSRHGMTGILKAYKSKMKCRFYLSDGTFVIGYIKNSSDKDVQISKISFTDNCGILNLPITKIVKVQPHREINE